MIKRRSARRKGIFPPRLLISDRDRIPTADSVEDLDDFRMDFRELRL